MVQMDLSILKLLKTNMKKLSVVLATRNEEQNIARCLESVKDIAHEIIIFDEQSTDKTVSIAKSYGAHVFETAHHDNFHITKQKAIEKAQGEWILLLDADEEVSKELAKEIRYILNASNDELKSLKPKHKKREQLFRRHTQAVIDRDGKLGNQTGEIVAYFIPRVNMFIGKPLIHGGVYPDGIIRLIKKGKAYLPARSVHEQMVIDGEVSWLYEPLNHYDSPTIKRYLERLNRYTDLSAQELREQGAKKDIQTILLYTTYHPLKAFVLRYVRHAGFKDGMRGFLWATFSAWHYPISYFKYFFLPDK